MKLEDVMVPPFLPDTPEVRSDILDYYSRIQRFDRDTGEILKLLQSAGRLDNTLFVMTSDNGMPFPRAKTNLYDSGTRMPLAVRWPARVKGHRRIDDFISFTDFAPTLLEAASLKPLPEMTGRSFLALLTGAEKPGSRNTVFLERERHANVRRGDLSYPVRAVRTREFLYIWNLKPDRWPGGDPEMYHSVGPFGDCDNSPTKDVILERREDPGISKFFKLAFAKRPAEELYDLARDPHQLTNMADRSDFAAAKNKLRAIVQGWMIETADPLASRSDDPWDHYRYFGPPGKMPTSAK
jgi:arylsulfatase A-like enzyme